MDGSIWGQMEIVTISSGRMTQSNGSIYLTDIGTGMKMQCKQEGNNLVFNTAPAFLKRLKFEMFKDEVNWTPPEDPNETHVNNSSPKKYNFTTAKKRREELYDKTFDTGGKDVAGNYGRRSSLVSLKKDKTFTIKVFNNIIAKGTWSQDGNIIKMVDTDAKCNYYLIIHKDRLGNLRLQSMLIPGDWQNSVILR